MPPPTQRWSSPSATAKVRIVSARSRSPFGWIRPERAHRGAAADRLERRDQVERGDLRAAGDRAAGQHGGEQLGQRHVRAQLALDRGDEMRDPGELPLRQQLRPVHAARRADAREVVALEVDDHHVLGGVLRRLDRNARGPRALDRRRPHAVAAPREQQLRRGGDDRPAVACERLRLERTQRRERARQAGGIAVERRAQVLDEVHLVDVALRDRRAHRLDRGRVLGLAPARPPLADRVAPGRRARAAPAARSSRRPAAAGTAPAAPARAVRRSGSEQP